MNIIESAGLGKRYRRTWALRDCTLAVPDGFARGGVPSYSYQPVSRFWSFQLIEGGWLLALTLVLLAATVWLVRRSE